MTAAAGSPAPAALERALDRALDRALAPGGASELDPAVPAAVWQRALAGPATEFLARPGKQLRAAIVHAGWALGGGAPDAVPERLALVIELLHAGSLIVDDVEDGADERRGGPALHRLVGMPIAINTGSWMYFWALGELAGLALPPERELAAHRAACAALVRCHQGQALRRLRSTPPGPARRSSELTPRGTAAAGSGRPSCRARQPHRCAASRE